MPPAPTSVPHRSAPRQVRVHVLVESKVPVSVRVFALGVEETVSMDVAEILRSLVSGFPLLAVQQRAERLSG